jgi:hypothetical protein
MTTQNQNIVLSKVEDIDSFKEENNSDWKIDLVVREVPTTQIIQMPEWAKNAKSSEVTWDLEDDAVN